MLFWGPEKTVWFLCDALSAGLSLFLVSGFRLFSTCVEVGSEEEDPASADAMA